MEKKVYLHKWILLLRNIMEQSILIRSQYAWISTALCMLNERSQSQKETNCIIVFKYNSFKSYTHKNRWVVVKAQGEEKTAEGSQETLQSDASVLCLNRGGYIFPVVEMKMKIGDTWVLQLMKHFLIKNCMFSIPNAICNI